MADLSKIKVGDKLVCTGRVVSNMRESQSALYPLEVTFCDNDEDTSKLSLADVQAAEHIPAPRVFKRGDWVRTLPGIDSQTSGIVTWVMSGGSTVRVHWPSNISEERLTSDLEPDEAPE